MKLSTVTKTIGKRGWLGVVLFAIGLLTYFGAYSQAQTEIAQDPGDVFDQSYQQIVAKGAGYDSFTDAIADENRKSSKFFMCVGGVLVWWGYKKQRKKKSESDMPQISQPTKTE